MEKIKVSSNDWAVRKLQEKVNELIDYIELTKQPIVKKEENKEIIEEDIEIEEKKDKKTKRA